MESSSIKIIQEPRFHGTANFPQPFVLGFGSVNADGTKNTNEVFHPEQWSITKVGTGVYRVNHLIGHKKYNVQLTVVSSGPFRFINLANKNNDYFDVYTGTLSGVTASDQPFEFVMWLNK